MEGVLKVFSTDSFQKQAVNLKGEHYRKYCYAIGLPNLGNTCYMNSLLQALTGCPDFVEYVDRIFREIKLDPSRYDSIAVFQLIKTLEMIR